MVLNCYYLNDLTLKMSVNDNLPLIIASTQIRPVTVGVISLCGKVDEVGGIVDGFLGDMLRFYYFSGVGALSNQANGNQFLNRSPCN